VVVGDNKFGLVSYVIVEGSGHILSQNLSIPTISCKIVETTKSLPPPPTNNVGQTIRLSGQIFFNIV
jgi:hypothetical protein